MKNEVSMLLSILKFYTIEVFFVLSVQFGAQQLDGALFRCPYFSHSRKSFGDEKEDKVFVRAFSKKLAGVGQRPTLRLFFFDSFFLWPTHAKKKAGNGYDVCDGNMREKPFDKSFFSRSFPKPFIKKALETRSTLY